MVDVCGLCFCCFFFFNDTATTEIYTVSDTLSLHDALPICTCRPGGRSPTRGQPGPMCRSEEHTSELQSPDTISYAVFCLKKKKKTKKQMHSQDVITPESKLITEKA